MHTISVLFTLLTALLHGYFFILETFLWTTPFGLKTFQMSPEKAEVSKVLAANQGVYNGLLALGLLLTFFMADSESLRTYCLSFIVIAGCYGAYSLRSRKVFLIQALPALIALITG